jgi:hypothetical protein
MINQFDTKEVDMAEEQTPRKSNDPSDETEREQEERQKRRESGGNENVKAPTGLPAPRGRMPLFRT